MKVKLIGAILGSKVETPYDLESEKGWYGVTVWCESMTERVTGKLGNYTSVFHSFFIHCFLLKSCTHFKWVVQLTYIQTHSIIKFSII